MTALYRSIQIALTALVFYLLWHVANGQDALALISAAQPFWIVAALLAFSAQTVLSALRWRLTAARLGLHLTPVAALREYYLSQMVNQTLPGGVLGDAARAVRTRNDAGLAMAGLAVVLERLAGQIALVTVLACGFAVTYFGDTGFVWPTWAALAVALIVLGTGMAIAVLIFTARSSAATRTATIGRHIKHALIARDVVVPQVTLSLATALCNLAAFAFCARAVGVILPVAAVFVLVPLVLFAMLVPFTISGWGVREGAATLLLPLAGITAPQSLAASVAFGLTLLVATLPGLLALWWASQPHGSRA